MNVYRNIVSDSGNAGFGGIAVNGEPLAGPVVDNDEWWNFERSIVAMMCYEYGRDVAHHPVHYCLLFNDLLPRWADDGDNDEYAWELTSDDLQRAVSRAKDRLANNSESDLFAAVLSLRPVLLESLIMLGLEPGYLTYKRLLDWYDDDNVHHRNRQSRLEILRLMLKHGLDPCFKPRDWEGESLLHFMCGSCTPDEDIGLLLAAGASEAIHNRDLSDKTARGKPSSSCCWVMVTSRRNIASGGNRWQNTWLTGARELLFRYERLSPQQFRLRRRSRRTRGHQGQRQPVGTGS